MADPITPLLNFFSSLLTAKASLRLLITILFVVLCFTNVQPYFLKFNIPSEFSATLAVLIGFATGSLTSSFLFSLYDNALKLIKNLTNKRKLKIEKLALEKHKIEENNKKIEMLQKSLHYYSEDAQKILIKLLKDDSSLELGCHIQTDNAITGMIDSEVILVIDKIEKTKLFCTINPIYRECISKHFDNIFSNDIDDFFIELPDGAELLIKLFSNKIEDDSHVFTIPNEFYDYRFNFEPIFLNKTYSSREKVRYEGKLINDCAIHFCINSNHYDLLCKKLGVELREFILCKFEPNEIKE